MRPPFLSTLSPRYSGFLSVSLLLSLVALAGVAVFADTACTAGAERELGLAAMTIATDCAPAALPTYNDARAAIHNGGANWLAPVLDLLIGCIGPTVRDELSAHGILAQLDDQQIAEWAARFAQVRDPRELVALAEQLQLEDNAKLANASPALPLPSGASRGELTRATIALAIEQGAKRVKLRAAKQAAKVKQ